MENGTLGCAQLSGRIAVIKERNRVDTGKRDEKECMIREEGVRINIS